MMQADDSAVSAGVWRNQVTDDLLAVTSAGLSG